MLPIGVLLAGGAAYVSIKAYKKLIGKRSTHSFPDSAPMGSGGNFKSIVSPPAWRIFYHNFVGHYPFTKVKSEEPLPTDLRQQQMADISSSSTNNSEIIEFEQETKEINYYLSISSIALGLATAGVLVSPPLSLLSVPMSIYAALPIFKMAFQTSFQRTQVEGDST